MSTNSSYCSEVQLLRTIVQRSTGALRAIFANDIKGAKETSETSKNLSLERTKIKGGDIRMIRSDKNANTKAEGEGMMCL